MATNSYESTPGRMDTAMPMGEGMEQGGEPVPCVHIYAMPDGTFGLKRAEEAPPEGLETAESLDAAMAKAAEMLAGPSEGEEDEAMTAAKAGYARKAQRPMMAAPNPGGVFGE